jgi:hypothetical protein
VLDELAQDVLEMQMRWVREAPISRAQETPMTPTLDGSGVTLLQGVPDPSGAWC